MTTIAFDGKFLAADTCLSLGSSYGGMVHKIVKINDGYLACSGNMQDVVLGTEYIVAYYMGDKIPKPQLDSFGALYVTAAGAEQWETKLAPFKIDAPCSEGSGWELALGAMLGGRTAWEACYIAALRDLGSGLPIQYVDVTDPNGVMITMGACNHG